MDRIDHPHATAPGEIGGHHFAKASKPKLLFLATEDWFFYSHFMPFLREALSLGMEVVIVTRVRKHGSLIAEAGCRVIPLETERSSLNPLHVLANIAHLRNILKGESPDIVHCISLRLVVLGGLAARQAKLKNLVLAPVGLGHIWISAGIAARFFRAVTRTIVGRTLRRPGTTYLFENDEDPREFGLHPNDPDVVMIGGAGVDPAVFFPMPEPPTPPLKVAVVARMTNAKGVLQSLEAVKHARMAGVPVELHLFGGIDVSNRGALDQATLERLCRETGAVWHGHSTDIRSVWRDHHVAMLLSEREGLPRSLIEAAACGRPIVATDVTGCRSVVRHEKEGLLVPKDDVQAASQALIRLAGDVDLRRRLGGGAARRFDLRFTETAVRRTLNQLYRRYLPCGSETPEN